MVQTLAGFIGALQAVILPVKSAQTCFIVNQSTETELVSGINFFFTQSSLIVSILKVNG